MVMFQPGLYKYTDTREDWQTQSRTDWTIRMLRDEQSSEEVHRREERFQRLPGSRFLKRLGETLKHWTKRRLQQHSRCSQSLKHSWIHNKSFSRSTSRANADNELWNLKMSKAATSDRCSLWFWPCRTFSEHSDTDSSCCQGNKERTKHVFSKFTRSALATTVNKNTVRSH